MVFFFFIFSLFLLFIHFPVQFSYFGYTRFEWIVLIQWRKIIVLCGSEWMKSSWSQMKYLRFLKLNCASKPNQTYLFHLEMFWPKRLRYFLLRFNHLRLNLLTKSIEDAFECELFHCDLFVLFVRLCQFLLIDFVLIFLCFTLCSLVVRSFATRKKTRSYVIYCKILKKKKMFQKMAKQVKTKRH